MSHWKAAGQTEVQPTGSIFSRLKSQHYGAVKPSFLLLVLISLEDGLTLQLFWGHSWPNFPHFPPYPARDDWPVSFPQSLMLWILLSSSDGQLCCNGLRCTERQKANVALGLSSSFMSLLPREALFLSKWYLWEQSSVLGPFAKSWRKLEVRKDFIKDLQKQNSWWPARNSLLSFVI